MNEYRPIEHFVDIEGIKHQILDRSPSDEEMLGWPEDEKEIYRIYPPFTTGIFKMDTRVPRRCVVGWTGSKTHPHRLPILTGFIPYERKDDKELEITDGICEYCVAVMKTKMQVQHESLIKEGKETMTFDDYFMKNVGKFLMENYQKMEVK